jgi:hypothetical protein
VRQRRIPVLITVLVVLSTSAKIAGQFVVFPKAGQIVSPNGRFLVRSVSQENPASDLVGTFQSLWLTEIPGGRSQKLCDYVGIAAVAWAGNDYVMMTQYVAKKTSRLLLFPVAHLEDALLIDESTLIRMVPAEVRPALRENDHVFIEASRVENDTLRMSVWGYGQHDKNGFRWHCEYELSQHTIACAEVPVSH